jgi:hypothetical protein
MFALVFVSTMLYIKDRRRNATLGGAAAQSYRWAPSLWALLTPSFDHGQVCSLNVAIFIYTLPVTFHIINS